MTRRRRLALSLLCWLGGCFCMPILLNLLSGAFLCVHCRPPRDPFGRAIVFFAPLLYTVAGYLLALPTIVLPENTPRRKTAVNLLIGFAIGPFILAIDTLAVSVYHPRVLHDLFPDAWLWEVFGLATAAVTAVYLYLITPPAQRRKR